MYANDDDLAADIDAAGIETHDRVWRMPLWEEYQQQLTSAFADMINIGGPVQDPLQQHASWPDSPNSIAGRTWTLLVRPLKAAWAKPRRQPADPYTC